MRHAAAVLVPALLALAACGDPPVYSSVGPPSGPDAKWKDHMGDIPFVVGQAEGMRVATSSGRQPMYFFTATW